MKCSDGWNVLSAVRNAFNLSKEWGQMRSMSSMYRFSRRGLDCCVRRKRSSVTERNMLAIVGENEAPMAVPLVCWSISVENSK